MQAAKRHQSRRGPDRNPPRAFWPWRVSQLPLPRPSALAPRSLTRLPHLPPLCHVILGSPPDCVPRDWRLQSLIRKPVSQFRLRYSVCPCFCATSELVGSLDTWAVYLDSVLCFECIVELFR